MGKRKRSGSFTKTDDSGAKKSDDCDSQEELDGDPLIPLKNSNGVRCSARVQEKQEKLRREASPSKQIILDVSVPIPGPHNSSSTITKTSKRPVFPDEFDVLSTEEIPIRLKLNAKDKRKKRNWELWSLEDKQLFFEALNEHGKDFDAIQNYFATKLKPKSKAGQCLQPLSKNKDQVRHFYYRTWNKISKYLQFPKDMKKAFQELYGLVNYGELRKKLRVLNSKTAVKLSELVQKGTTAIKVRGKTFRIKTPVCRALKRLNRLEDIEHSRVPCKISLELIPKNGKAWAAVQGVSHNPRVKVYVPLQRTLASVITYFEDKWKSKAERLKQEMAYTFGGKPVPRLRIFPFDKNDVNLPIFKLSENTSSAKISLRSYTENVLSKEIDEELELCTKKLKRRRKASECCGGPSGSGGGLLSGGHFSHLINGSEAYDSHAEADASDIEPPDVVVPMSQKASSGDGDTLLKHLWGAAEESEGLFSMSNIVRLINRSSQQEEEGSPTKHCPDSIQELLPSKRMSSPYGGIDPFGDGGNNADTPTDVDEADNAGEDEKDLAQVCSVCSSKGDEPEDMLAHVWDEETIQRGWTAPEAGVMTVGELYLMMGKCEKLCFEYCWDQPEELEDRARINRMLEKLVNLASSLKKKKSSRTKSVAGTLGGSVCANCGGVPPTPFVPLPLTPAAVSNVNIPPLQKPAPAPSVHFKSRVTASELMATPPAAINAAVAVTLASTVEPVVSNTMVVSATAVPTTPLFSSSGGGTKAVRTILPSPISISATNQEMPPHPSVSAATATKSKVAPPPTLAPPPAQQPCDVATPTATATVQVQKLTCSAPVASPTPSTIDPPAPPAPPLLTTPEKKKEESESSSSSSSTKSVPTLPSPAATPPENIVISIPESSSSTPAVVIVASSKKEETEAPPPPPVEQTPPPVIQQQSTPKQKQPIEIETKTPEPPTFRRPGQIPIRSDAILGDPKTTPPKPFLDLPKGNRRIGRKPNWKRMVIPRELPLLPKFSASSSLISISPASANSSPGSIIMSSPNSQILIPIGGPLTTLPTATTVSAEILVTTIGTPTVSPAPEQNFSGQNNVLTQSATCATNFSDGATPLSKGPTHTTTLPRRITPTTLPAKPTTKQGNEVEAGTSKRNFPVNSDRPPEGSRQMNICDEILNVKSISMSSSSFEDLLKVRQQDARNAAADMESNLSLSSFMEISLPESTKLEANEFTSSDRFLDMGMDESINSNLSMSDYQERGSDLVLAKSIMTKDVSDFFELKNTKKSKQSSSSSLQTPTKSQAECSRSQSPPFPSQIQSFLDNQWSEPGDLSLSSLLGTLEPIRSTTAISESEFQSMLGDSSQDVDVDFTSRFSEIINESNSLTSKCKK